MALSNSTLSALMQSYLTTQGFSLGTTGNQGQGAWVPPFCDAIAQAVVDHINAAAKADDPGGTAPGKWPIL